MAVPHDMGPKGARSDDIAIVGLACRFPGGASGEEKLWDLLSNGKSAFSEVPPTRFNAEAYHHSSPNKLNTLNSSGAHFLSQNVAAFDAPFFGITAQEANAMDPAARMLLEVTFEAFENAGQRLERIAGSDTSCYVGCFTRDYHEMLYRDIESAPMYTGTGTGFSLFSNRISWFYDLRGPSMTLDTACSSSLVGLHLACRGLQAGESSMAVVCGANLILSPDIALTLSNLHMLSMDGLSRSFAEGTTGYGRGEGISSLVLKRVKDALRDGDHIRGVIRGSGVNQDGHTKGITVPNSEAQAELITAVYSSAGLDPSDTGYFEAHGTGTAVGDPLELGAIAKSISRSRRADSKLLVGSIKSNIGHLEGSAGLAGVIKCILMLEKKVIVPNIHFEKPNRRIPFDQWRISVPTSLTAWPNPELRRASVNSFGYGGTNAHVVIDDADSYLQQPNIKMSNGANGHGGDARPTNKRLFVLSAPDESALKRVKETYSSHFTKLTDVNESGNLLDVSTYLDNLSYTLGHRRSNFACRSFVMAESLKELTESFAVPKLSSTKAVSRPRLGFVFTGQGAQWPRMGLDLMIYPVFAESIQKADKYLSGLGCKWSALKELSKDVDESQIGLAEFSQPLCTIVQVALVNLLKAWKIVPAAVIGHSSGEIGAAYSYGALTQEDAWKIAYWRGQLCSQLPQRFPHLHGTMAAVGLGPESVQAYIDAATTGKVVVACINSPSSVTLSGDATGIDEILEALKLKNVFARRLKVNNAYHSHHMANLADDYLHALNGMVPQRTPNSNNVSMVSSVTGTPVAQEDLGPSYWLQNLVSPVLFLNAMEALLKPPTKGRRQGRASAPAFDYLVEIGPHAALRGPLRQILQAHSSCQISYSSVLLRGENGCTTARAAAGELFGHGVSIDTVAVNSIDGSPAQLVDLPPYPWNHSLTYWADSRISRARQHRKSSRHDLLGAPSQDSDNLEPRWRHFLRLSENPWIRDHVVHSSILYPGSGILAMPIHALQALGDPSKEIDRIELRDVKIVKAIVVPDDQFGLEVFLRLRLQRSYKDEPTGWWEFSVCSNQENDVVEEHGYGLGKAHYIEPSGGLSGNQLGVDSARETLNNEATICTTSIPPKEFYEVAESVGLAYGPSFRGLTQIDVGKGSCTWKIKTPDTKGLMTNAIQSAHIIHPTTLDIIFHSLFAAVGDGKLDMQDAAVPIGLDSLSVAMDLPTASGTILQGVSKVSNSGGRDIVADIWATGGQAEKPSVIVCGLRCRKLPGGKSSAMKPQELKAPVGSVVQKPDVDLFNAHHISEYISRQELPQMSERNDTQFNIKGGSELAISTIVDLVAHKNPNASLVQVGGASGRLVETILTVLEAEHHRTKRFRNIQFLDTDDAVVNAAAARYKALSPGVQFRLAGDNLLSGLGNSTCDLVLLCLQGIAIDKISGLLWEAARCVKLGGRLLVLASKGQIDTLPINIANDSTYLSLEILLEGGLGTHIPDKVLAYGTKRLTKPEGPVKVDVVIVLPPKSSLPLTAMARELEVTILSKDSRVHMVTWPAPIPTLDTPPEIVSLLEFEQSLISNMSKADFDLLKALVLRGNRLLWVVKGRDPILQTATGFLRSLSNENAGVEYSFLQFEDSGIRSYQSISSVIKQLLSCEDWESEYKEVEGSICCSRWSERQDLSALVGANDIPFQTFVPLSEIRDALTLTNEMNDAELKPTFVKEEPKCNILKGSDVEIEIRSLLLGKPSGDDIYQDQWREAAGVVVAAGLSTSLPVGARVAFAYLGPISTIVRINEWHCQTISQRTDFQHAIFRPFTIPTAYHALFQVAHINSDKTVFVYGGSSILGQAGVILALALGANVYASVKNEKESSLLQGLGLPTDHILNENESYQYTTLVGLTGGHGFDAVLNTTGDAEAISRTWLSMAKGGKFIEASNTEAHTNLSLNLKPFKLGASFEIVNLCEDLKVNGDRLHYKKICDGATQLLREKKIDIVPTVRAFTVNQVHAAVKSVTTPTGPDTAAIVLFPHDARIPASPMAKNQLQLRSDATYVLAGGLGGLGRTLAKLLVDSGARYLMFLSRTGPNSQATKSILEELVPRGVTVDFYACDITEDKDVSEAFAKMAKDTLWPPVRGIIQSAAVLRDSVFETMSYAQWTEAIRPKVLGSWNLHKATLSESCAKDGLDFFVMLASISGFVGNRGQANYAAGNSYQDALAQYRRSLGLAATSVDLGLMQDIGLIAERGGMSNLKDNTVVPLTEDDFNLIFKMALNSEGHDVPGQIITGLPTGGILQKQGIASTPFYYRDRRFARMQAMDVDDSMDRGSTARNETASIGEQLSKASSRVEATAVVLKAMLEQVAKALRCPPENIDPTRPMHAYGMDSLMAVDMRSWVQTTLKAEISLFDVMSGSSIGMLVEKVSNASKFVKSELESS